MNTFLKEILEQPQALKNTLEYYESAGKNSLNNLKETLNNENIEQVIFTGMGSSFFTSFAATNLFNRAGIISHVINASELLHYNLQVLKKKTLLFCLSQSGESYEITELQKKLPKSVICVGISNEENSTLAQKADMTFLSYAGPEYTTSTKTYVSIQLIVYIIGWALSGQWEQKKIEEIKNMIASFQLDLEYYQNKIDDVLNFMGDLSSLHLIARGSSYSTAMQSSLMLKETLKVATTGYLGGEFRHGPMEMVKEGFKTIIFAPEGKTYEQSIKMAKDISGYGGKVLLFTNKDIHLADNNIMVLPIRVKDEYLFSIESIIPVQLFIDFYAKRKGFEAGSFARGGKVTAIE
jgi:glucosamine--fructose-6-phosphate aminotransferase (isomerizing)